MVKSTAILRSPSWIIGPSPISACCRENKNIENFFAFRISVFHNKSQTLIQRQQTAVKGWSVLNKDNQIPEYRLDFIRTELIGSNYLYKANTNTNIKNNGHRNKVTLFWFSSWKARAEAQRQGHHKESETLKSTNDWLDKTQNLKVWDLQ